MEKMQFTLFSKISFEVSDPIALIECFCFQNDFYKNYDYLLQDKGERTIKNVNRIGARIKEELLEECEATIYKSRDLEIFKHDLDSFLKIDEREMEMQLKELNEEVIQKLLIIDGIGFSKVTKMLHTSYPLLIPMIDNPLQAEYKGMGLKWDVTHADKILLDFYQNLKEPRNHQNISLIHKYVTESIGLRLTKIRIFDIIWWSYLKAMNLKKELEKKPSGNSKINQQEEVHKINWTTIKRIN